MKQGGATAAPAVKSGSVGMGTLTGSVGVVKTDGAKSGGAGGFGKGGDWEGVGMLVLGGWVCGIGFGLLL